MAFLIPVSFTRLPELTPAAVADILILAFVIYQVLLLIRGTRAVQILLGVVLLVAVYYGALWGRLQTVQWLLDKIFPYLVFFLIVIFQGEIRRGLAKIGRNPFASHFASMEVRQASEDIILAASTFSSQQTGALIVIERDTGLRTFTESGIPLQAALSYDLLIAIFQRSSPLHDGAVIINKDKIVAAACFLPLTLSVDPILGTQLGTRHRAAIGITEETDAVAVAVSEQTGAISLAIGGAIETNIGSKGLAQRLSEIFQYPLSSPSASPASGSPLPEATSPASSERVATGNRL